MSAGKFLLYSLLSETEEDKRRSAYLSLKTSGVDDSWFIDFDERKAYNFVNNFFMTHGVLPSTDVVTVETGVYFPQHPLYEPFDYFLGLFKEYYKEVLFTSLLDQINEHHDKDEAELRDAKLRALVSKLNDFSSTGKSVKFLSEVTEENLTRHTDLQQSTIDGGVNFGIPYVDEVSGGAQKGDIWVIAGNSGSGKSFITCRMAMGAVLGRNPEDVFSDMQRGEDDTLDFLFDTDSIEQKEVKTWPRKKVLFISMEMTNNQIGMRDASLGSKINGMNFRLGKLPHYSVAMIRGFLKRWKDWGLDDKLILVEGNINMSVQDVLFKIQEYKPDIVIIDGAYMLRTGKNAQKSRWETILEVTETLKRTAMSENIPVIATFQFDQKAKEQKLDTIMGGQAIGHIASVAIGLDDYKEGNQSNIGEVQFKTLSLLKGRNGEKGKIVLRYDMGNSVISQHTVLESSGVDREELELGDSEHPEESRPVVSSGGFDISSLG